MGVCGQGGVTGDLDIGVQYRVKHIPRWPLKRVVRILPECILVCVRLWTYRLFTANIKRLNQRSFETMWILLAWTFLFVTEMYETILKREQWTFPLIQPSFVKLTQLAEFAKTGHAWQYMEQVLVWGLGGTESSVAYLVEHQTYNPRAWLLLPPKFWSVVKFFS